MRFAVSLLALRPGRVGGTEHWLRSLLLSLPGVLDGDEVVVVAGREAAEVPTPGLERVDLPIDGRSLIARRAAEAFSPWRDRELESVFSKLEPDAVFFPQISLFPKSLDCPSVLTVGDLQHLVKPRSIARVDRVFRRAIYPYSLEKARIVMAMSEQTRRDLVRAAKVAPSKIRVVRPGCPPMRTANGIAAPPVPGPFLYYPAVTHPHKGHEELIDAFAELVIARVPLRLVLSGQRTPYWAKLERKIRSMGLGERVHHLGYVSPETVVSLQAHAAAVVFPSRFEGFGLPIVEAASLGARVIASRLPVFDENGTEGVHRIDFRDAEQLRAALASPQKARIADGAWSREDEARAVLAALRDAAAG